MGGGSGGHSPGDVQPRHDLPGRHLKPGGPQQAPVSLLIGRGEREEGSVGYWQGGSHRRPAGPQTLVLSLLLNALWGTWRWLETPAPTHPSPTPNPTPCSVYIVDDEGRAVGIVTPTDALRLVSA